MPTIDDKNLIALLKKQETRADAFTRVIDMYKEQLYWTIRRMVLSHEDTDDILQNTFMKAWLALDSFRGDAKISSWLYRIATNETLNFIERKKLEGVSLDNEASGIAQQLEGDPYFDGDETELQLQQAIASLPGKQRQVFNLKYFEDMKYEDMSEILGTSVGALKASYHHAVKKICDFFNDLD